MSLVIVNEVVKEFSLKKILDRVSLTINPEEKLGLIGRNGAGKTTLLKIISGEIEPDQGEVFRNKKAKIGHLKQITEADGTQTLLEHTISAFKELTKLELEMKELEEKMSNHSFMQGTKARGIMDRYAHISLLYKEKGGLTYRAKAMEILQGIGFKSDEFSLPLASLSGGQLRKAEIAELLAGDYDLILLDEPTNHLDVESIIWLETFLKECKAAFILISHDRYLLDATVNTLIELENGKLYTYFGNYAQYKDQKQKMIDLLQKKYELQQAEIRRQEEFIRKNIAGQKTRQAQSRQKMLARIERIERPFLTKEWELKISAPPRSGKEVLKVENIRLGYEEKIVLDEVSFSLYRGDHIGLIGPNGCGKTTLLKAIMGQMKPLCGRIYTGYNVSIGYYDQNHFDLDKSMTVLEELWSVKPELTYNEVRSYLGRFMFSQDEVNRVVRSLSGGEMSRLVLAKLFLLQPNLLLLDEPTTHLDINSIETLEEALRNFPGTFLLVSHDRNLLDRVVDKLFIIKNRRLECHLGNYSDYANKYLRSEKEKPETNHAKKLEKTIIIKPSAIKLSSKPNEKSKLSLYKKKQLIASIEKEIEEIEARLNDLWILLSSPKIYSDGQMVKNLKAEEESLKKRLDDLYWQWNEVESDNS